MPAVVMAVVPALQCTYRQWLSLTPAALVVTYAARPFHRAVFTDARHGAATTDTLIPVGAAAFGWSLWALFLGPAGTPGMTHPFELTVARGDGSGNIYREAAAGATVFILAGRYFEARSQHKAGAALRAPLELGAQDVTVPRAEGREETVPTSGLQAGHRFPARPGEETATDGTVVEGAATAPATVAAVLPEGRAERPALGRADRISRPFTRPSLLGRCARPDSN